MTEAAKSSQAEPEKREPTLSLYISSDKGLSLEERLIRRQIHYHEMRLEELRKKLGNLKK